jgi:predicted metal-dependent peptidase
MDPQAIQVLDAVSRATNKLIFEEPFYGHFFVGLLKEVHQRVETLAVGVSGQQIKLHINPNFWNTRLPTQQLQAGLLKHEILHVVLKHIFRHKDYKHKELFNIACDLVVNQYIAEDALPADRLHLGLFPELNLRPEMDAHYYYESLLPPWEKILEESEADDTPGTDTLKQVLENSEEWRDRHKEWQELDQLPGVIREVLEQQVTEAVRDGLDKARGDKRWGKIPANLRSQLEAAGRVAQPAVNWRRILRHFAESSSKTYLKSTLRRPSKRFGTSPGIKVRRRQRILLVIDTSGSIGEGELRLFFQEIYHIWKRGAEIEVVECDARIQRTYPYKGETPKEVSGGGGTDFNPPLHYANTEFLPDALIYFTDGYAPAPTVKARYPLLWVVTPEGIAADSERFAALPGRRVKVNKGAAGDA